MCVDLKCIFLVISCFFHCFLFFQKYYILVAKQLTGKQPSNLIGHNLSPEMLDNFREEQLGQLMELFKETQKPKVGDPPGR